MNVQNPPQPTAAHRQIPYYMSRTPSGSKWAAKSAQGRRSWPQLTSHWHSRSMAPSHGQAWGPCRDKWSHGLKPLNTAGPVRRLPELSHWLSRDRFKQEDASYYTPHLYKLPSPKRRSIGLPKEARDPFGSGVQNFYKPSMLEDPWADLQAMHSQSQTGTDQKRNSAPGLNKVWMAYPDNNARIDSSSPERHGGDSN